MSGANSFAARWYAPDEIVPTVPMTPTRPVSVTCRAARMPGAITPMTGMSTRACNCSSAAAAALLHATTSILMRRSRSRSVISNEYLQTSSAGFGP
jgi:hypothetical protein